MILNALKRPLQTAYRMIIQSNLALHGRSFEYVLILAHMRSGSTVLSHILASHPEFAGAGETHVKYRFATDLPELVLFTCQRLRKLSLKCQYVVDQINHDEYVSNEVLLSPSIHGCIILIRSPEATLKSLISLFGWTEQVALDSYLQRMGTLAKYGAILRDRALLVEYDDLVDDTKETLRALTEFLEVKQPFEPVYTTHSATGRYGDPSKNIVLGRVVRTPAHLQIEVGVGTVDRASAAFNECREKLILAGVRSKSSQSSNVGSTWR